MVCLPKIVRNFVLSFAVGATIVACGGGSGGGGPETPAPDGTPDSFQFVATTDAPRGETLTSPEITVNGVNQEVAVAITGGLYSVDGGDFTDENGVLVNGQRVVVRAVSSSEFSTDTVVTLTIGGVTSDYVITTLAQDITPDSLEFTAQNDAARGEIVESANVTIAGINDLVPVSIVGGEYALGASGTYTSTEGEAMVGDVVRVRVTTSDSFSTPVTATLSVGETDGDFTVTTLARDITPEPFSFPAVSDAAPGAMIESASITVAGLNDTANIAIVGGEYAIGTGDTFTADAGQVDNDDVVRVRVTAAGGFALPVAAMLSIGDTQATFTVTTVAQDTIPDAFTFTQRDGEVRGEPVLSDIITVMGINDAASVSITGGSYSVNGAGFTAGAGQITNGQTLQLQVTASAEFATTTTGLVTVGGQEVGFSVVSEARDVEPAAFSFGTASDVDTGAEVTSAPTAITGINDSTAVTISGGTFRVGGTGEYTAAAKTVSLNDEIEVRATASSVASDTQEVSVMVGEAPNIVTGVFTIMTVEDLGEPEGEILFPPVNSATRGNTVKVRGTATDAISRITAVRVSGEDATDTSGDGSFSTWEIDMDLLVGDNTLTLEVVDEANNTNTSADAAEILRADVLGAFPDAVSPFVTPMSLDVDAKRNRLLVGDGMLG